MANEIVPCYSIGWSTQNHSPLVSDSDHNISIYKIKGIPAQRYICMASHRGPIWVSFSYIPIF